MQRAPTMIAIEEQSGNEFADLQMAQRAALSPLAAAVTSTLRDLLAMGVLVIDGGYVVVSPTKDPQPNEQ